jgi:hypothetical protein
VEKRSSKSTDEPDAHTAPPKLVTQNEWSGRRDLNAISRSRTGRYHASLLPESRCHTSILASSSVPNRVLFQAEPRSVAMH